MLIQISGNKPFSGVAVGNLFFHSGDFMMKTKRLALPDGETMVAVRLFGGDPVNATTLGDAAMVNEYPGAHLIIEETPTTCGQ